MAKISVITPTVRPEGLALVAKALKRQTFKDFEWKIVGPWGVERDLFPTYLNAGFIPDPEKEGGDVWVLNKAYNHALRIAEGDLIISWQDYTYAKPDALQKFWDHYQHDNRVVVSGIGNKYADDTWTVVSWQDPRKRPDNGSYYPCYFVDIEFNFAAIPKAAFYAVGGFDEAMDVRYGMDGYSVVDRLNLLGGWEFYLDQTNETFSLEHGRLNGEAWDANNWNGAPYLEYRKKYLENPVLPYLA